MDIETLLADQGPELLEKLQQVGLNSEQAQAFLPEAGDQVAKALSGGSGLANLLGGGGVDDLLRNIDTDAIAEKVGIGKTLAEKALQALVPIVMKNIGSSGGAAGMLGGLASKFLK